MLKSHWRTVSDHIFPQQQFLPRNGWKGERMKNIQGYNPGWIVRYTAPENTVQYRSSNFHPFWGPPKRTSRLKP